jgi:hypothetical protein
MAVAIQDDPIRTAMQRKTEIDLTGRDSANKAYPDRIKNKSAYEMRRQEITAQERAEKERQKQALERSLAQRGIEGGIALKQQRLLDAEARKLEASRLGTVDIEELLAKERETAAEKERATQAQEAEKQRKFLTGERLGTQTFQSEEREKDRVKESEYQKANLSLRERELAQNADQFNSKQEFDRWAIQSGYSENEKNRAWEAQQNANQQALQVTLSKESQQAQLTLEKLRGDLELGKLNLASQLDSKAKLDGAMADAAFNLGKSGETVPQWRIDAMTPLERVAFSAGKSGAKVADYETQKQNLINYRNALITTLDPDDPKFISQLNKIMVDTGGLMSNQTISAINPATVTGGQLASSLSNTIQKLAGVVVPKLAPISKTVNVQPQYVFKKQVNSGPPR